jgi:hypothetical protein
MRPLLLLKKRAPSGRKGGNPPAGEARFEKPGSKSAF